MSKYGECSNCKEGLKPVWYVEAERDNRHILTGRKRQAVSHLICPSCLKNHIVDDSFDKPWEKESN